MTIQKSKIKPGMILLVLLIAFAFFFFFYKLGENHLIEFDEGIYGVVAQNILKTRDWITLTWRNGIPWYDKGPLYFWLMAISLKVLGNAAFAVRFWSAVFGFGSIIIVYLLGKELFDSTVGLLSGFVLASTTGFLYYGRLGMLDVPAAFFIGLSVYFLLRGKERRRWFVFAGVVIALGFLTRGFIGLLGLVSCFAFFLLNKTISLSRSLRTRWYADRHTPLSNIFKLFSLGSSLLSRYFSPAFSLLVVFLIVAVPWHLLMYQRHGKDFLQTYFGHQMFSRFAGAIEGKSAPRWWYITVIKTQFRIWFVVLLAALPVSILAILGKLGRLGEFKEKRASVLFVFIWSLVTFSVFTAAGSKLIWYIMPIYLPLSILVGYFLNEVFNLALPMVNKTLLVLLVFAIATFYNILMWPRILTKDFTRNQALAVAAKDRIDAVGTLCCVDMGWSVCQFYNSKAEVIEATKDSVGAFFKTKCRWVVTGEEGKEKLDSYIEVGRWEDVFLLSS